jgi:hypothetical protein
MLDLGCIEQKNKLGVFLCLFPRFDLNVVFIEFKHL